MNEAAESKPAWPGQLLPNRIRWVDLEYSFGDGKEVEVDAKLLRKHCDT